MEIKASVCWRLKPMESLNLMCPHHVVTSFSGVVFICSHCGFISKDDKKYQAWVLQWSHYICLRHFLSTSLQTTWPPMQHLQQRCSSGHWLLKNLGFPALPTPTFPPFNIFLRPTVEHFLHVTSFVDSAQLFSFLSSLHYHPSFLLSPGVSLP